MAHNRRQEHRHQRQQQKGIVKIFIQGIESTLRLESGVEQIVAKGKEMRARFQSGGGAVETLKDRTSRGVKKAAVAAA